MPNKQNFLIIARQAREKVIQDYFNSWILRDSSKLNEYFTADIIYSECYGPEYHGIHQILQWFSDWIKNGSVLEWYIKQFVHQDNMLIVEWFFKCNYEKQIDGFDGISLVQFDKDNRIVILKEFQSKEQHYYPYEI